MCSSTSGTAPLADPFVRGYCLFSYKNFMDYEDTILQELMDMPGEIFDIPELQDQEKFDVEGYINGDTDY